MMKILLPDRVKFLIISIADRTRNYVLEKKGSGTNKLTVIVAVSYIGDKFTS